MCGDRRLPTSRPVQGPWVGGVACNIERFQVRRALTSLDDAPLLWIGGVVGVHASLVATARSEWSGEERQGG